MKISLFSVIKLHLSKNMFLKDWRIDHQNQKDEGRVIGEWEKMEDEFEKRLALKQKTYGFTLFWVLF